MSTVWRIFSCFSISIVCMLTCHAATITLIVPFENAFLNPNDRLQASFSFGVQSVLFCFATNTQIVGIITWPFQGVTQTGALPIFLTTNGRFSGQFTDPNGMLTIQNNTGQLLQVGCLFGY